ncbi:hypothetical protein IGI04_035996 [Brassica rapa subsp. trilocularis]|uniref:Uncharacterized protein n=1 Tax=Brassica rapa subsp. trilocularis TaxID=1813537 RepID=A0ABQ7LD72_BRACM|nr:hypothetical protein IGI04_035996 [Brassica rapa subsp. trilocularis]
MFEDAYYFYAWLSNRANIRQGTSSLTPSTCENLCASPSIDMESVTSIDSGTILDLLTADNTIDAKVDQPKEPKLTSNTNLTSLLVLGLGIHGIGFFRQVWKTQIKEFETGLGGGSLQNSLSQRTLGYRSKRNEQNLVATTIKF